MQKTFIPGEHEDKLYNFWERNGYLKPGKGEPFTILMPPPNANASLHAGHGMYVIDDIMIRWKRINGFSSLWIPGLDHAGFETQYVYEKHLAKEGKSRFDFDRETLYQNIFEFVKENSGLIYSQFKRLGFLADWERSVFTLDEKVTTYIASTFKKMHSEGFIHRDQYIVNYCVHDGTTLADLEVKYIEREDPLYYIRYPLADGQKHNGKEYIIIATVRPETIPMDTHLAVNPKDNKNRDLEGKRVLNPITGERMEMISDGFVDPKFGTGIVKLTPAHDPNDFAVAKKRALPVIQAIDWRGRMVDIANKSGLNGMKVKQAREDINKRLQEKQLIEKIDDKYLHRVPTCYKCARDLELLTLSNWFIKVESLKEKVKKVVKDDEVKFIPAKYKKQMLDWLEVMHDWPISRQIVWGIRIPVWYKVDDRDNITVRWIDKDRAVHLNTSLLAERKQFSLEEIKKGLQEVNVATGDDEPEYVISQNEPKGDYIQETDTFDTWFSSGQWPLVTLNDDEIESRFPTDFMGTLSDILKFWISRMIMFSLHLKQDVPFKNVYLWSMVADAKGKKMSKSRGNVINPIDLVDKYGADAFRTSLLFGVGEAGKVNLSEDKVRAMRNFANKIWNVGRFILMNRLENRHAELVSASQDKEIPNQVRDDKIDRRSILEELQKEASEIKKQTIKDMETYKFSAAFASLYEFAWHRFADFYIEQLKESVQSGNITAYKALEEVLFTLLILLHPFMPFVTEAIWKEFKGEEKSILDERL